MSKQLSTIQKIGVGSIHDIMANRQKLKSPIVQILQINSISHPKFPFKYKVSISDTKYYTVGMISNSLNEKIEGETFKTFSIVELSEYNLLPTFDQNVLIINDMNLLYQETKLVGQPDNILDFSKKALIFDQEQSAQTELQNKNQLILNKPINSSQNESTPNSSQPPHTQGQLSLISPVLATVINQPLPIPNSQPVFPTHLTIGPSPTQSFNDISNLTPYLSNWTIFARVVMKSHKCKSAANQFFSIILKDKSGSEIRGIFFDESIDKFYDVIKEDQIYKISGGVIRDSKVKTIDHDYEIIFNGDSTFLLMPNDDLIGKYPTFHFIKLNNLSNDQAMLNTYVDIIGYIIENREPKEVLIQRTNEKRINRMLIICDDSNTKCEVNLWDNDAEHFPNITNCIVVFKDIIVCDLKGRSLRSPLKYYFEPDIPEVQEFHDWLHNCHDFEQMRTISKTNELRPKSYLYLSQIDELGLGNHGKKDFGTCIFTFGDILDNQRMCYPACPNCNQKMEYQEGKYFCNTCQNFSDKPEVRFAFKLKAQDFTGATNLVYFGNDKTGLILTGNTPNEWAEMTRNMDEKEIRTFLLQYFFQILKARVSFKKEIFNNIPRIKCTLENVEPINFAEEACFLADEIRKYDQVV